MCIAVYLPAGKVLTDDQFESCAERNPDGFGFCYINTDHLGVKRLIIKKSMDAAVMKRQLARAQSIAPESPFLVHFRIATHGVVTEFNCHPFSIDENHAFIHNGVISGLRKHDKKSDTQIFNDDILKKLPEGWMKNDGIAMLIEDFIGYNKVVAMNIDGEVTIYNEGKGEWFDGIWFSNTSYKSLSSATRTWVRDSHTGYWSNGTTTTRPSTHQQQRTNVYQLPSPPEDEEWTEDDARKCQSCKTLGYELKVMTHYYDEATGLVRSLCPSCNRTTQLNGREVSTIIALDFCNSKQIEAYQNFDVFFADWSNPWAFGTDDEIDDYTDSLYDARLSMQ